MTPGALEKAGTLKAAHRGSNGFEFLYMHSSYSVLNLLGLSVRVYGETGNLKPSYGI